MLNNSLITTYLMYQYFPKPCPFQIQEAIKDIPWVNLEKYSVVKLETKLRLYIESKVKQPSGVFLSGGLDSSLMAALCSKYAEVHAFTAVFQTHSEWDYAKIVADHLGIHHHEVPIKVEDIVKDIYKITRYYGEPLADAALINNYYVGKALSDYTEVAFTGDGGDEIFGGYPWHHYTPYISIANAVPAWLRRIGQRFTGDGDPTQWDNRGDRILMFPLQDNLMDMLMYPTTSMSKRNVQWLLKDYAEPIPANPIGEFSSMYNRMLASDCSNLLYSKYGTKAEKFGAANRITIYSPFVTQEIISLAFEMPVQLKKDKAVLKMIGTPLLPYVTIKRKKAGFGTPFAEWMNNKDLKAMILERLDQGILLRVICKEQSLNKIIKHYQDNQITGGTAALNIASVIWELFTLQVWDDTNRWD